MDKFRKVINLKPFHNNNNSGSNKENGAHLLKSKNQDIIPHLQVVGTTAASATLISPRFTTHFPHQQSHAIQIQQRIQSTSVASPKSSCPTSALVASTSISPADDDHDEDHSNSCCSGGDYDEDEDDDDVMIPEEIEEVESLVGSASRESRRESRRYSSPVITPQTKDLRKAQQQRMRSPPGISNDDEQHQHQQQQQPKMISLSAEADFYSLEAKAAGIGIVSSSSNNNNNNSKPLLRIETQTTFSDADEPTTTSPTTSPTSAKRKESLHMKLRERMSKFRFIPDSDALIGATAPSKPLRPSRSAGNLTKEAEAHPGEDGLALLAASAAGDVEKVAELIKNKVNVNVQDAQDQSTPLHKASLHNHVDIMRLLIDAGAQLNATNHLGATPLHYAVSKGHREAVQVLAYNGCDMNVKDKYGLSPLALCLRKESKCNLDVASDLLLFNADIEGKRFDGRMCLHVACENGNLEVVKFLLEKGARVHVRDKQKQTPLLIAIKHARIEVVRYLLSLPTGTMPESNLINPRTNRDENNNNLLHVAAGCTASSSNLAAALSVSHDLMCLVVDALKNYGLPGMGLATLQLLANEHNDLGLTPLHVAVSAVNAAAVKILIQLGADVNKPTTNKTQDTPLHICARKYVAHVVAANNAATSSSSSSSSSCSTCSGRMVHLKNGDIINTEAELRRILKDLVAAGAKKEANNNNHHSSSSSNNNNNASRESPKSILKAKGISLKELLK